MHEYAVLAYIRRARGIQGEVVVESAGSPSDRFQPGLEVFIAKPEDKSLGEPVEIEKSWLHNREIILRFWGIETRTEAEGMRGMELRIPAEARPPLPPGEYYLSDLVGCRVVGTDGRDIGEVMAWNDFGAAPLLDVRRPGCDVLVPWTPAIYREVDLAGKRIVVELPEGLEELNAR